MYCLIANQSRQNAQTCTFGTFKTNVLQVVRDSVNAAIRINKLFVGEIVSPIKDATLGYVIKCFPVYSQKIPKVYRLEYGDILTNELLVSM
jgi:L-arabinose isomerase